MPSPDRISIKARVRISILTLVLTVVLALSGLHLFGIVGETLEDAGDRASVLAEQIRTYLIETVNRPGAEASRQSFEAARDQWYRIIAADPVLSRILQKSTGRATRVVGIVVLSADGHVLAASDPLLKGSKADQLRSFREWQAQGMLSRLRQLLGPDENLAVTSPLGLAGQDQASITVRVALSSALLRSAIYPQIRELTGVSALSLAMSGLLAILVSNLVSRSLQRIGRNIDRIASGDPHSNSEEPIGDPELELLESKLAVLAKQYNDTREDAISLRSNLDQMLRNLEEAVLVFGPDGRLQMAGEPAVRLLARPRETILGQPIEDVLPGWTSLGSTVQSHIADRRSVRDKVVLLERPNLSSARLLLNLEMINYGDGRLGTLVTLRDADTRRELRSQLDTAERLAAISRLMSGVAHEIKNPLNAMMLHLQLALDKGSRSGDTALELEVIQRELLRLDKVVKTFLDFNRPLDLEMVPCDLVTLARDLLLLIKPDVESGAIEAVFEADVPTAIISGDQNLLKQAALNMLLNALDAMPDGGLLTIQVYRSGSDYVLAIKDTGNGVPLEIQDRIFNLYFTTKSSGTGIGLAVAYRVVQLHSGTITFDSAPGKGTCFRLCFPAHNA